MAVKQSIQMVYGALFFIGLILCMGLVSAFDWTSNLNLYYNCNNPTELISGNLNLQALSGTMNYTSNGAFIGSSCRITNGNTVSIPNSTLTNNKIREGTQNYWIYIDTGGTTQITWGEYNGSGNDQYHSSGYLYSTDFINGSPKTGYGLKTGAWIMITRLHNSTGAYIFVNGTIAYSGTITTTNLNDFRFDMGSYNGESTLTGYIDEIGFWNRSLNQTEIEELYNGGSGLEYSSQGITIIQLSPLNNSILSTTETNFTTNFNITGSNLNNYTWKNATYNVYKSGVLFNNTTVSLLGNNTQNIQLINGFVVGNYNWNVVGWYGNLTYSNYTTSNNFTYIVGATINSQIYSNNTYETSLETFSINVALLNGSQINLAKLIYNNVSYVVSNISISLNYTAILNKIITIPLNTNPFANQTNSFYWQFTYNGGEVQTLSTNTQNVNFINLQQCNGTYPIQTLNFTFFDELNQTVLNASINPTSLLLNFKYWLGSGDIKKTYNFQSLNDNTTNNYNFCLFPNTTLQTDMDMQYYTATGYAERSFYLRNYSINNISNNILLYSLLTEEATKFNAIVKSGSDAFTGAVVGVYKYFVGLGSYRLVMVGLTDDKGTFSANLDIDQNYNFTIVKDNVNYGSYLKQATCSVAPCEINIQLSSEIINPLDPWTNYIAQNVNYTISFNKTTKIVTLTFIDKLGTSQYWRLFVYRSNLNNDTIESICDEKSYSVEGTLTCNVTNYNGDIKADVFISRSPEKLVVFLNFINENYSATFGATAILASVIIILVIVFSGIRNPVNALILIPFGLVILKFLHFMPLSWTWIAGISVFFGWIAIKLKT